MFAPVSVYTLFISYIFFDNSREQKFCCLQTNDKIFAKKKIRFNIWMSPFFAKYDIVVTFATIIIKSNI